MGHFVPAQMYGWMYSVKNGIYSIGRGVPTGRSVTKPAQGASGFSSTEIQREAEHVGARAKSRAAFAEVVYQMPHAEHAIASATHFVQVNRCYRTTVGVDWGTATW